MSLLRKIERVPCATLHPYPGNARQGNVPLIAESLRENGQYAPLIVQASTRHVLAGNHTLKAALSLGWTHIDITLIDVDDTRARKINLSSNRTADNSTYDDALLATILASLNSDGGLTGTGYQDEDLTALLAALDTPLPPIPDFEPEDDSPRLDELEPRLCPKCGYDTANDPEALKVK